MRIACAYLLVYQNCFIRSSAIPPLEFLVTKGDDDAKDPVPNPDYDVWVAKDQQVLSGFAEWSADFGRLEGCRDGILHLQHYTESYL